MAAWEAGFVSYHAAGRSPQCGQPPQVPGPSLLPFHSLLPPRTPGQTDMVREPWTASPGQSKYDPSSGGVLSRSCLSTYILELIFLCGHTGRALSLLIFSISQGKVAPGKEQSSVWWLPCPACPLRSRWCGTCCLEHHRWQTFHLRCADHSPTVTQGIVIRNLFT